jgi:copper chaperone CopZ
MKKLELSIPTLYGDHHTTAVRSLLEAMDGVSDVYASSAFQQVSLAYDEKKVKPDNIKKALAKHGYTEDPVEFKPATEVGVIPTKHTAAYTGVGDTLSFAEPTPAWQGRPLWPCPGFTQQTE